jgi:membrane protein YdbS with pleckstrin-like domain
MNIQFECPYCNQRFERDDSLSATAMLCPNCKREIKIPAVTRSPEIKEARIVSVPRAAEGTPVASDKEETVLEMRPALRAFLGLITIGIVLMILGVALAQFVHVVFLLFVALAVMVLIDVWVKFASRKYRITNQRLFATTGLIARKTEEIELFRIKDVKVDQGLLERMLGYGTITVYSSDETAPQLVMIGIGRPVDVKETLRTLYRAARKDAGVRPTEFMMDS